MIITPELREDENYELRYKTWFSPEEQHWIDEYNKTYWERFSGFPLQEPSWVYDGRKTTASGDVYLVLKDVNNNEIREIGLLHRPGEDESRRLGNILAARWNKTIKLMKEHGFSARVPISPTYKEAIAAAIPDDSSVILAYR